MGRFNRILTRATYAGLFAAIGGFLGGIISRNGASTGAAAGALLGASIGTHRTGDRSLTEEATARVRTNIAKRDPSDRTSS